MKTFTIITIIYILFESFSLSNESAIISTYSYENHERLFKKKEPYVKVKGDCSFRINGDLSDPAPLFALYRKYEWLMPNEDGVVNIKNGKYIDMYCTSSFRPPFTNATRLTAQCLQGQYFLINGLIYPFSNLTCTEWPIYTARRTTRSCNDGNVQLEIGFVVKGGFLRTMDICHDEDNEVTRYVHHILYPASAMYQHSVARPRFVEGDFYGGKNVDQLYTRFQQNQTISAILGMDASPYFNDTIDLFLSRGHMAAKTDFIYGAQQKATFMFVNVAPQWQAFNGGNWERVEDGVRKYISQNGWTADCYTGTWGVSSLPDVNGIHQYLYLAFDENNNGLIPVPMIYYRIVIVRETGKGIVFIGVNNPHASIKTIMKEYVICEDIGNQITWIDWAKEDLNKGFSYACTVPSFTAVVQDLSHENLNVTGTLGVDDWITTTMIPTITTTAIPTVTTTTTTTTRIPKTRIPTTITRIPTMTTGMPTMTTRMPTTTTTRIPTMTTGIPTVTTGIPTTTTTRIPTMTTGMATMTTRMPTTTTRIPTMTTGMPTMTTRMPTMTTRIPTMTTGMPTMTTRIPTMTTGMPTMTTRMPTTTTTRIPTMTTGMPTMTTRMPTMTTRIPTMTTRMPTMTTRIPTMTTRIPTLMNIIKSTSELP